jgi:RNA polymerase sigma-70 factor (ECF subfamily)
MRDFVDEKELLLLIKDGNKQSFDQFASIYSPRLLKAAYLLCGNEAEAEDAVQDTFVRIMRSVRNFNGKSAIFTWLYGILLNVIREKRRKKRFDFVSTPDSYPEVRMSSDRDPTLREKEKLLMVEKLLSKLSADHREVLVLRYFEGLKISEMATMLKIPPGTVKSRLHNATQGLRKVLPEVQSFFIGKQ